ncbi:MAG: exodeoxyribonuclease VII large subunit [Bacteroidota bacterium]
MDHRAITLSQLNLSVKTVIADSFQSPTWIIAEISEMKVNRNGHCYLELIEKEKTSEKITARARATIWSSTFRLLKPYFETTTGHPFKDGIKVMLNITVEYHEIYGLSLNIVDIDPTYTLGDMAKKKADTIRRLKEEGIFEMNHQLPLPLVIQRIAIISSETAAGYGDFRNHLTNNEYGYDFYTRLFPAIMQGEEAEKSVIKALDDINNNVSDFDAVVIIRGGGAQIDLSCFDNYWLAFHVAQFPLPVLTGIGHDKDESVTDMVACCKLKTPTAVADFLIMKMVAFESDLTEYSGLIFNHTRNILTSNKNKIINISGNLAPLLFQKISIQKNQLEQLSNILRKSPLKLLQQELEKSRGTGIEIKKSIHYKLNSRKETLDFYHESMNKNISRLVRNIRKDLNARKRVINNLDPANLLKRGYSVSMIDGRIIKSSDNVKMGDELITILHQGKMVSNITSKN